MTAAPTQFEVEPIHLRGFCAVLMASAAMVEVSHMSRAAFPAAFIYGHILLTPIVVDIARLAQSCASAAANYEGCEASVGISLGSSLQSLEPVMAKAAAGAALAVESLISGGETRVFTQATGSHPAKSPETIDELLGRLQSVATEKQIRVEQAGRHFNLYLPGTQNWAPISNGSTFDLTSNLAAFAWGGQPGHLSAPEQAALQALKDSGFGSEPGDTATVVGYSEGALVGANLIAGGAIAKLGGRVSGLISVGGPISARGIGPEIPVVSLEHANDLVPQLDLAEHKQTQNWTTVKLPKTDGLGHSLTSYRQSVAEMGAANSAELNNKIAGLLATGKAVATDYVAVRAG